MNVFSALADPTRRNILEILASSGQLSASAIYDKFNISSPAISQHLKVLREAKLVDVERNGQQRLYHLNSSSIEELDIWVQKMKQSWNQRFDRLDKLFIKEQRKVVK